MDLYNKEGLYKETIKEALLQIENVPRHLMINWAESRELLGSP